VIGDNLWLWRADHSLLSSSMIPDINITSKYYQNNPLEGCKYHLVKDLECTCNTALLVTGKNVLMYGLAAEHTQKSNVIWSGDNGYTYFYQNELPYDHKKDSFSDIDAEGNVINYYGYEITHDVTCHRAYGVGVYIYPRDHHYLARAAVKVPTVDRDIILINVLGVFLGAPTIPKVHRYQGGMRCIVTTGVEDIGMKVGMESYNYEMTVNGVVKYAPGIAGQQSYVSVYPGDLEYGKYTTTFQKIIDGTTLDGNMYFQNEPLFSSPVSTCVML